MDIYTTYKENFLRNIVAFPSDALLELSEQPEFEHLSESLLSAYQVMKELYSWCGSNANPLITSYENEGDALSAFLSPMKALFSICVNGIPTEADGCPYLQVDKSAYSNTLKQLKLSKGEAALPCLGKIGINYEYRKDRKLVDNYTGCDSLWFNFSLEPQESESLLYALSFWGTALSKLEKASEAFTVFLRLNFRPCISSHPYSGNSETMEDLEKSLQPPSLHALALLRDYIGNCHISYKPVDIKLNNLSRGDWSFNYRKQPKVGKAFCGILIKDGKLTLRIVYLTEAVKAVINSRYSFGEKVRNAMLKTCKCKHCGGNGCGLRQVLDLGEDGSYESCVYPWSYIHDVLPDDIDDIQVLLEIQSRYMKQDPKKRISLTK